jgi:hypothetical protein
MLKSSVSLRLETQADRTLHLREYCSQHGRRDCSNCRHGANPAGGTGSMLQSTLCCQVSFPSVNNCVIYNHYFVASFEWITVYSSGNRSESVRRSDLAIWLKRVMFVTFIREMSCSKLDWDIRFRNFHQHFQVNTGMIPQIITRPFPSTPFYCLLSHSTL